MHTSPDGSFLLPGILACKECSSPSTKAARCPREEVAAGRGWQRARNGTRNAVSKECCVRVVPEGQGRPARPLNSASRSCVSSHSSICPRPCEQQQYLRVPEPRPPEGLGTDCASRQMAGNGWGSWQRREDKPEVFGNANLGCQSIAEVQ